MLGFALGVLEILAPGLHLPGLCHRGGADRSAGRHRAGPERDCAALLLIFAVVSVLAWLVLRRMMGVREGQVKIWDRDINDSK